eukprot:1429411-Rhodomonas_salina.1
MWCCVVSLNAPHALCIVPDIHRTATRWKATERFFFSNAWNCHRRKHCPFESETARSDIMLIMCLNRRNVFASWIHHATASAKTFILRNRLPRLERFRDVVQLISLCNPSQGPRQSAARIPDVDKAIEAGAQAPIQLTSGHDIQPPAAAHLLFQGPQRQGTAERLVHFAALLDRCELVLRHPRPEHCPVLPGYNLGGLVRHHLVQHCHLSPNPERRCLDLDSLPRRHAPGQVAERRRQLGAASEVRKAHRQKQLSAPAHEAECLLQQELIHVRVVLECRNCLGTATLVHSALYPLTPPPQ